MPDAERPGWLCLSWMALLEQEALLMCRRTCRDTRSSLKAHLAVPLVDD